MAIDGAGAALLKSFSGSRKECDYIYAIIKGSLTAPSAESGANVIVMGINDAGISTKDISYTEAKGTATPIGDPIEIEGLTMAFENPTENNIVLLGR